MTSFTPAAEPFAGRVLRHVWDLLKLAWPVMLSRAGILVMAFVDIAMLGRFGEGAVGISNLGLAVFVTVIVITIGLASGMVPVVSQAYGAGNITECGRAWRRGMRWGMVVAVFGTIAVWNGEDLLAIWQSSETAAAGGDVAKALAPGVLAQTAFAVCAFYLEATRRPMLAMFAMLMANVLNFGLNWVMIFGNLGFPELGAVGAAMASTIARFAAAGMLIWVVLAQRDPNAGVRGPYEGFWGPGGWRAGTSMRRLGLSAGLSNGFETVGFAAMTMIAGTLGAAALDAYSFSHNMVSTLFMIGLGLAVATGVRVGQATGAGRADEAAFAGWTGLLTAFCLMGLLGTLVYAFSDRIALVYTNDTELAVRTAGVFLVSAFVFVPDSMQVVLGQALRAMGDAWAPLIGYVASFIVLMIPLGWWLTARGGWDERGLTLAVAISCVLATVLLAFRFAVMTRRR